MAARKPPKRAKTARTSPRPNPRASATPPDVFVTYQRETVQCGKSGCRCNTDDRTQWHGPYWYAYWRDPKTGKKRSRYMGKNFAPPQGPPRPGVYGEQRPPPDRDEREARERARAEDASRARGRRADEERAHREREERRAPPPPPRGSRFEQAAAVLGLDLGASHAEAKRAYRKLALEHHPDRFRGAERAKHEQRMKEINAAWDVYQRARGWK